MRVEGTCRSGNGGGCPFFVCSPNILTPFDPLCLHLLPALSLPSLMLPAWLPFAPCLPESSFLPSIVANFQPIRAKRGKNEFLFGGRWCFLGKIGDKKGRNLNIFLKSRKENRCGGGRLPAFWRAHWSRGGRGFEASGPAGCWLWSSGGVFPAFRPLSCFALGALPLNMALFRVFRAFLAGFICLAWVCIASMLCVACGAFVCVRG